VDLVQALGTADAGTAEQEGQAGEEAREGREEEKDTEKEEDTAEHGEEEEGSSSSSSRSTLYQRQRLFSVYVHSPPNYTVPFDKDRCGVVWCGVVWCQGGCDGAYSAGMAV
jgi:hypothetical protein